MNNEKFTHRRRPRQANGVGCVSLASVISSARDLSPASRIKNIRRSPPPRPMAPHPVRPPRAKKSSVSSATEEETKKPAIVEKAPRRKKRLTEINPDDVLEARNRKYSSTSKDSSMTIKNEKRRDSAEVKAQLKEELMNNKNRVYGIKPYNGKVIEIPRGQTDIIYDKGNNRCIRKYNDYEKFNLKNKSYSDNSQKNCCHVNNEKGINEEVPCNEERIYEKNQGFYDLNRSAVKSREENCDRGKKNILPL